MNETKEKKENLFTYLNAIFYKNNTVEYNYKVAPAYILTLWLSHDQELIEFTNEINKYLFLLPDKAVYNYYYYKIPKKKRFIQYIKKEKKEKEKDERVNELAQRYNISRREAELCLIAE